MKHILLAATALALLSTAAYAQNSRSNSGSTSSATNSSVSRSQSISGATASTRSSSHSSAVGNTTNVTVEGVQSGNGAGQTGSGSGSTGSGDPSGTDQYIGYGGGYTVRNTPEVIPPSVVGGNACAVGASGGLSLPGFGVAMGGTWADKACERRQQAALLFNMGEKTVAYEMMCQDENVRNAMRTAGKPCAADQVAAATPPAVTTVAPAPAAPVAAAPARPVRPDWCVTASPAERRAHAVCDLPS